MTREVAIETINEIKSLITLLFTMFDEKEKRERRKEALDIAIKALSQEPCDDAISREDVIDKIRHAEINFTITSTIDFSEYKKEIQEIVDHIVEAQINAIKQLPSVTQKSGKWIKGKCSICGEHAPFWSMATTYYESKFCPNCGAKMFEPQESEEQTE